MSKVNLYDTIISPVITEKSSNLSSQNKVVFKVRDDANKKTLTFINFKNFIYIICLFYLYTFFTIWNPFSETCLFSIDVLVNCMYLFSPPSSFIVSILLS